METRLHPGSSGDGVKTPWPPLVAAGSVSLEMPSILQLRVWINSLELDHQLASGCPPWLSPELELRTLQLASARCRWDLARGLEAAVRQAEQPGNTLSSAVPVRRTAIRVAADGMLELAIALTDPSWNNVRGVALASCLLRDAHGPLFVGNGRSLRDAANQATGALRAEL